MRLAAAMPFMATWKKLPSSRMGKKNSAASRMMNSAPARLTLPAAKRLTARAMPAAAPP